MDLAASPTSMPAADGTPRSRRRVDVGDRAPDGAARRARRRSPPDVRCRSLTTPVPIVPKPIRPTRISDGRLRQRLALRHGRRRARRRAPCGCRARPGGCGARSRSARSARTGRRTRRSRCRATPPPCASCSRNLENSSEPIGAERLGNRAPRRTSSPSASGTCQPARVEALARARRAARGSARRISSHAVLRPVERVRWPRSAPAGTCRSRGSS